MSGVGSLVSGAMNTVVGLANNIRGGQQMKKERKRMDNYFNQLDTDNEMWYNANAQSDYTQRADAQNLLRNLRENLQTQNQAANNMAVVTGMSMEQQAVQKAQANKAIADTYANIGVMGQQWKDNITNQYLQRKDNVANQRIDMMNNTVKTYENMMNQGAEQMSTGFGQIGEGINSMVPGKTLNNKNQAEK